MMQDAATRSQNEHEGIQGAARGAGHTLLGLWNLAREATGHNALPDPAALTPKTPAERGGYNAEQLGEFFLPGGEVEKGVEGVRSAIKGYEDAGKISGILGRFARFMSEAAIRGGADAGIAAAQGGNPLQAGLAGAAVPIGIRAAGAAGRGTIGALSRYAHGKLIGDLTQATREGVSLPEMIEHARAEGIPATTAQLTDSGAFKGMQKAGQIGLFSGKPVAQRFAAIYDAMNDAYGRFLNRLAPADALGELQRNLYVAQNPTEAGATTQSLLKQALDRERLDIGAEFRKLDDLAGDARVKPNAIAAKIKEIEERFGYRKDGLPSLLPKQTMDIVRDIKKWPGVARPEDLPAPDIFEREFGGARTVKAPATDVPWSQVQDARSALLKAGHLPGDPIEEEGRAALRELAHALDTDLVQSSTGLSPEAEATFRQANQRYRDLSDVFANARSPVYQAILASDPATVNPMLSDASNGGSEHVLDALRKYLSPDGETWPMNAFRRDFVRRLGDDGSGKWDEALFQQNLAKYSDPYLQKLFAPGELEALRAANRRSIARTLLDRNENGGINWRNFPGRWKSLSDQELAHAQFSPDELNWMRRHAALAHAISEDISPSGTPTGMAALEDTAGIVRAAAHLGGGAVFGAMLGHPVAGALSAAAADLAVPLSRVAAAKTALSPAVEDWALRSVAPGQLTRAARPVGKLTKFAEAAAADREGRK